MKGIAVPKTIILSLVRLLAIALSVGCAIDYLTAIHGATWKAVTGALAVDMALLFYTEYAWRSTRKSERRGLWGGIALLVGLSIYFNLAHLWAVAGAKYPLHHVIVVGSFPPILVLVVTVLQTTTKLQDERKEDRKKAKDHQRKMEEMAAETALEQARSGPNEQPNEKASDGCLEGYLLENPSATIREVAELIGCSVSTVSSRTKKLGWMKPRGGAWRRK